MRPAERPGVRGTPRMKADGRTLLTPRLKLDWLTAADAELMLNVWNDPDFLRYVGDRGVRTADDALRALEAGPFAMYETFGYGPYRVALRENDVPIGICGLFRRPALDEPDIGYAVLPDWAGQGYAMEAARAVLDDARDRLQLPRLTAIVSPENERSIRLLEKLGLAFTRMFRLPGDDSDVALYAIDLRE